MITLLARHFLDLLFPWSHNVTDVDDRVESAMKADGLRRENGGGRKENVLLMLRIRLQLGPGFLSCYDAGWTWSSIYRLHPRDKLRSV
jgi:hypothetical protein